MHKLLASLKSHCNKAKIVLNDKHKLINEKYKIESNKMESKLNRETMEKSVKIIIRKKKL